MFTVKIVNHNENSTHLKSWSDVNVWSKGSEFFNEELAKQIGESDCDEEKAHMKEFYIAFIVSLDDEQSYCLTSHETAYITDASGNTVQVVRA